MSNLSMCFISVLVVILTTSLIVAIAQENSSIHENSTMKEISNTTSNNTLMNNVTSYNTSLNTSAASNIYVNITKPESIKPMNNTGANTSINLSTVQSEQSNGTIFILGNGSKGNKSTYKVDIPTLPAKNASYMWYIIQATPHGYV